MSDFSHVANDRLRQLLRHWLDQRNRDLVPMRSAIDPTALPAVLPHVWMCDYLAAERRFRMRLAGEEINRLYGHNIGQRNFEEIFATKALAVVMRRYRRVAEEPAILHCAGAIYLDSGHSYSGERLILPLLGDGGTIEHLIGVSIYQLDHLALRSAIASDAMTETFTPLR